MSIRTSRVIQSYRTFTAAALVALALGCSRDNVAHAATTQDPAPPSGEAQPQTQVQEDAKPYALETATVGDCKAKEECTATIKITAQGDFHVNETYPFKFTAKADGVEFHGSGEGNAVFTGGAFARQGKTVGLMTVKFKPSAPGNLAITGTYKICICNEKICQPSTTPVTINVNVK
jgi:hypothetical protein